MSDAGSESPGEELAEVRAAGIKKAVSDEAASIREPLNGYYFS